MFIIFYAITCDVKYKHNETAVSTGSINDQGQSLNFMRCKLTFVQHGAKRPSTSLTLVVPMFIYIRIRGLHEPKFYGPA